MIVGGVEPKKVCRQYRGRGPSVLIILGGREFSLGSYAALALKSDWTFLKNFTFGSGALKLESWKGSFFNQF